jgi:hypothetical protein
MKHIRNNARNEYKSSSKLLLKFYLERFDRKYQILESFYRKNGHLRVKENDGEVHDICHGFRKSANSTSMGGVLY